MKYIPTIPSSHLALRTSPKKNPPPTAPRRGVSSDVGRKLSDVHTSHIIFLLLFLFPFTTFAQNTCPEAVLFTDLQNEPTSCITGTNENATPELPMIRQSNCREGADMPFATSDVWYSFTATGNLLDLQISHSFNQLVVALYEGSSCEAKIGRDCWISSETNFEQNQIITTQGGLYFLQISGADVEDKSEFDLCLTNYLSENNICIGNQQFGLSNQPQNGSYGPRETIRICLIVEDYFLGGFDWLHGIVPILGEGWDASTLRAITPPESCDGEGEWKWYDEVISTNPFNAEATGVQGPGFFYDSVNGTLDGSTTLDGNPGNNYGDNPDGNACNWEFCLSVTTTATCVPEDDGKDLSITFLNFADSETGSTTSSSECFNDPNYQFKAVLSCCDAPSLTKINPTCTNPTGGSITATAQGQAPFTFSWSSSNMTETSSGQSTLLDLTAGYYAVTVTDNNGCSQSASVELKGDSDLSLQLVELSNSRCNENSGTIRVDAEGGASPYTYSLDGGTPQSTSNFENLAPTTYTITTTDADGCSTELEVEIQELGDISATIITEQPDCLTEATTGSIAIYLEGGLAPFLYSLDGATPQTDSIFNNLAPATYEVQVSDSLGCSYAESVTIKEDIPLQVLLGSNQTIELGDTVRLAPTISLGAPHIYEWSPTSAVDCVTCPAIDVSPTQTTQYTLEVFNEKGCSDIAQVTISVIETLPIFNIPTAFSPNNDGLNDKFIPLVQNEQLITNYEFHIFDRWGNEIFETIDLTKGWDGFINGETAPMGTYVYWFKYRDMEGEEKLKKGNVVLIR